MRKTFLSLVQFTAASAFPVMVITLLSEGYIRIFLLSAWLIIWVMIYSYLDKLILFFIGAREIIDADFQPFFQAFKNEIYRNFEKMPKVYLYTGQGVKCFVLESRHDWSVVLDRALVKKLNDEQVQALVEYLVRFKKTEMGWRLTKSYGLSVFTIRAVYWFWSRLFLLSPDGKWFRIMTFFNLILVKPFVEFFMSLSKGREFIICDNKLSPIIHLNKESQKDNSFGEFLFQHIHSQVSTKYLTIDFIETFPVLECAMIEKKI